ncbi:hypothetical protein ABIB25_003570 [Nakamurella sp. UYEF19]|uniref:hypothetical protein n=1 Tax=Nakamurella sp. UYEF19 TaxID=1756392 RepID=UPI003399E2B8
MRTDLSIRSADLITADPVTADPVTADPITEEMDRLQLPLVQDAGYQIVGKPADRGAHPVEQDRGVPHGTEKLGIPT